jgi:hypothetical protein
MATTCFQIGEAANEFVLGSYFEGKEDKVQEFYFRKMFLRRQRVSPRRRLFASGSTASPMDKVKRITAWIVSSQAVGLVLLGIWKF